jgi:predicted AAA+ superfamily ATPase
MLPIAPKRLDPEPLDKDIAASLRRIAEALDRLSPPPAPPPDFTGGRIFRHEAATGVFRPAGDFPLDLNLLVGVDAQKAGLVETLERFAAGLPANHVLLWGARGAGKSSLAKAAFMAIAAGAPGLKLIEVDRDEVAALPALFDILRASPERFIVLCDDLSFEEGAAAAKALKSALEGGVSGPPANALFLATSNRRHLMPRQHTETRGPLSAAEDAEEEVSVSDRFGVWIGFAPMSQDDYLAAVRGYAARFDLGALDLETRALQWSRQRGGRSGRIAWQFTRHLAGEMGKPLPL